jgi:hypothetical protein
VLRPHTDALGATARFGDGDLASQPQHVQHHRVVGKKWASPLTPRVTISVTTKAASDTTGTKYPS